MTDDPTAIQAANRPDVASRFVKGDPRINRKGRPRTFDNLRREAIKIAGETLTAMGTDGKKVEASRVHTILLDWASSKDVRKQQLFMEYTYGKVPNKEEHSGTIKLETWQDEVIALLKSGYIDIEDVKRELGDELAQPILIALGMGGST